MRKINEPFVTYRRLRPNWNTSKLVQYLDDYFAAWGASAKELKDLGVFPERCFANRAMTSLHLKKENSRLQKELNTAEKNRNKLSTRVKKLDNSNKKLKASRFCKIGRAIP